MKNTSESIKTLVGLVEHYSPSGQEAAAVRFLVERMERLGFQRAWVDEAGNAVGVMGDGPRQIVLLGHIDTVPGEIPVRQVDGVLYGRGAVDAKGPLAAFVSAVAAVGAVDGWQLVVIGAVDEERESLGARHVVNRFRPAFGIVGEPSGWQRLTLGYKGSARARIALQRSEAHSASGQENAPEAAFAFWQALQEWAARFNAAAQRQFEQVQLRLLGFHSETDGFASRATLHVQARLPLALSPEAWYAQLQQWATDEENLAIQTQGYAIPAWRGERRNPLVRAFLGSIRALGGRPGFVVKTGTADVNIVAPVWQCPLAVYGPGDASLDHTPHEHIVLREYELAVGVLQRVLQRLTQPAD